MPPYEILKENENWLAAQEKSKATCNKIYEENIQNYLKNPLLCLLCQEIIPYHKKKKGNKFCNRSCAASYNNKQRGVITNQKIGCTLIKYHSGEVLKEKESYILNPSLCLCCNQIFSYQKRNRKFCNPKCQQSYYSERKIKQWLNGEYSHNHKNVPRFIKRYLINLYGEKCSICNWADFNLKTGKVPIEVDHVDGNWKNNTLNNLRLLCPNCHSIQPTYKALNKGNGRTLNK